MPKRKQAPRDQDKAVPIVQCPAELSADARKVWDEVAPLLIAEGRLTELSRIPFAIFCSAVADWFAANAALQTYGAVIKSPSGYPVQSPYVSVASKHLDTILKLATEFGLTPASLRRIADTSSSISWTDDLPVLDDLGLKPLVLNPPDKS